VKNKLRTQRNSATYNPVSLINLRKNEGAELYVPEMTLNRDSIAYKNFRAIREAEAARNAPEVPYFGSIFYLYNWNRAKEDPGLETIVRREAKQPIQSFKSWSMSPRQ